MARIANVAGPLDPGSSLANENSLIGTINNTVGALAPAAATVATGSDTTTDALYNAVANNGLFVNSGDRLDFFAYGTTAADTNSKTWVLTLTQGTTSNVINLGSNASSGASWEENLRLIWDGSTFRYSSALNNGGTISLANGSTGTTFVNTSALSVTLSGKSAAAATNEIVALFAGGHLVK